MFWGPHFGMIAFRLIVLGIICSTPLGYSLLRTVSIRGRTSQPTLPEWAVEESHSFLGTGLWIRVEVLGFRVLGLGFWV